MPARRRLALTVVAWSLMGALGAPAWATIDNFKSYKEAYPGKDPKAYSCKVCHLSAVGKKGELNGYGQLLQRLSIPINTKKLTEADFRAVEPQDPDQDGATTLQELEAGTDPDDPASVPEGVEGDEPEEGAAEGAEPVAESTRGGGQ